MNHVKGAKKKAVYCYDLSNMKFVRKFEGQRIMVRELKISNINLIIRKLGKDAVFCARYNGEVIKWYIKSKSIKDSEG